jgi:CRISPR-associated protein (Cas_Cas02710)
MMRSLLKAIKSAWSLLVGSTGYLSSVFVGVILAPIAPDAAVDVFGDPTSWWLDPLLRFGALVLVLVLCVLVYRARVGLAARRSRRSPYRLTGVERHDVLVLPLGHNSTYQSRSDRTKPKTVPDWLVDAVAPTLVIAVATPQINSAMIDGLRTQLAADGIDFDHVELRGGGDLALGVPDAEHEILAKLKARNLLTTPCAVDVTGGTVPMSIAMLRVASLLGATCTYVFSTEYKDNKPVPGTQVGKSFDPRALLATPS